MADDLRQLLAEAMASAVGSQAFKIPHHAWDGFRNMWLGYADAALAVRDEELWMERTAADCLADLLRDAHGELEQLRARLRALHPSREEADAAGQVLCVECAQPAPCRTRQVVDDTAATNG